VESKYTLAPIQASNLQMIAANHRSTLRYAAWLGSVTACKLSGTACTIRLHPPQHQAEGVLAVR